MTAMEIVSMSGTFDVDRSPLCGELNALNTRPSEARPGLTM